MRNKGSDWWFAGLLTVVVLALYGPSIRFGLIWDDPRWYQQGAGLTRGAWQYFAPLPTYQFYRPLAILLNRQFVSETGVVNATLAHAVQIGAHLIATLASVPALRALDFEAWHARLTALLFAIYPPSYQAVAWQAPQGPLVIMWVLLSLLAANAFRNSRRIRWLALSLAFYASALLFQESAAPFVFLFFWLAVRDWPTLGWRSLWPLLHLSLAIAYLAIWLLAPRQAGVTGSGFQSMVLAYLLQGVAFPISGLLAGRLAAWPLTGLMILFAGAGILLALGLQRWASGRSAAVIGLWIAAGLLPIWAGLSWGYVEVGSRLLYPASLGIAGLWAGWGAWTFAARQPEWRRALGGLLLFSMIGLSLRQWGQFQKLYQAGTQHLTQAVNVLSASPQGRILFVNFPDRIEFRPPLYPLGFWGLTLAPVVQNLSDFARAETGRSAEDRSLSAFLVGADEREAWSYRMDMRGVNSAPEALFDSALWADSVYLSDYLPDGGLGLRAVGDVRPMAPSPTAVAILGEAVELAEAKVLVAGPRTLNIRLIWNCLKPLPMGDTIFIHFWQSGIFYGDADGDSLGELIPLWAWQPGATIEDIRQIDLSNFAPGAYEVRVGIYNRDNGVRHFARQASVEGSRFPEDEIVIGIFSVP